MLPYVDLHTHTTLSDGQLSPRELVALAREKGIRILAISDHNHTADLTQLRKEFPDMILIQAAEFSCTLPCSDGKEHEFHVIGLGFDPSHPAILDILRRNRFDRRPYIEAILAKLEEHGIHLGTYDSLKARFPNTLHLGRKHIATVMVEMGYVETEDQAFDEYIGRFGARKAFVESKIKYVPLEDVVRAILAAGGFPVFCHPFYYGLEKPELLRIMSLFHDISSGRGATEVFYAYYTRSQMMELQAMADQTGLMYSAASDYHSEDLDSLDNKFSWQCCRGLLQQLGVAPALP